MVLHSEQIVPFYGYLKNTASMDGAGIDVWVGSGEKKIDAIMCIVELMKRD